MTELPAPDGRPVPQPPEVAREPAWGLGEVGMALVAGLVLSTVFGGVWLAIGGGSELGLGGRAFSQVGLWLGLVGVVLWATRRKGNDSVATDFGFAFRSDDVLVGVVAAVAAQFVVLPLVTLVLQPLLGRPDVGEPVRDLVEKSGGAKAWVLVLMAAVGAPLVEELFFRGLLMRALRKRAGQVWAIAGSAVAFGLAHPNDVPFKAMVLTMAGLAALGAVLAYLAVRTGRLGASIVAHATFNAISLAFAFFR